tara:strand:- start:9187 stop:9324 length:138 start_codon:yes stop_codon:yes gene_type:complete
MDCLETEYVRDTGRECKEDCYGFYNYTEDYVEWLVNKIDELREIK